VKRSFLALFLSISLFVPMHSVGAANFVEPMVKAWQMMDAMRQMMEWFVGGSNRNGYRSAGVPFGSLYATPYGSNLSSLGLLGLNRNSLSPYAGYPAVANTAVVSPLQGDGEWLRDPVPYEESFWGDDPYWDSRAVPLGEGFPARNSGYEGLDGIWFVKSGERWLIQGNQFALVRANGMITKGEFTIKDDWLVIRYNDHNTIVSLQFRQMDNLLLIRDRSGTVALLRRFDNSRPSYNAGGYTQ